MVNQELVDQQILHLLYLIRYQNSLVNNTTKVLRNEVYPEVMRIALPEIDRISQMSMQSGVLTYSQQVALDDLRGRLSDVFSIRQIRDSLRDALLQLSEVEAEFLADMHEDVLDIPIVPIIDTRQYIQQPFEGRTFDRWMEKLGLDSTERVLRTISVSLMSGGALSGIVQAIRGTRAARYTDGKLHTTTRQMEALIRSAVIHMHDQASRDFERQNDTLFEGVVVVGMLDTRRCLICAGYEEETRHKPWRPGTGPVTPFHMNCRCSRVPVIDGVMPSRESYGQWLRRQTDNIQTSILGTQRAALFRDGKLRIDQFINNGELITLEELRRKYPEAFKKAGL